VAEAAEYCDPAVRLQHTINQCEVEKWEVFYPQCCVLSFLIDVYLPGIVYRILLSKQNLSPHLNIILNLLIYRHF